MPMKTIHKIVLNKAIKDPIFAKEVFSKLPSTSFDGDGSMLYHIIKQYYQTNSEILDENTFATLVENKYVSRNKTEEEITKALETATNLYNVVEEKDRNKVMSNEIAKFVKRELSLDTLQKALVDGSFEDEDKLDKLSRDLKEISILDVTGESDSTFLDFFNDTERKKELYKNMRRNAYPTGLKALDDILDGGGLGKGEVMMIIALTGYGKTNIATQLAVNTVKNGRNALYITLEEKIDRMSMRLESNLTGFNSKMFYDEVGQLKEDLYDKVQERYKNQQLFGELFISKHNPQQVTIDMLEQIIVDTKIRKGINIDQVVIDYPALMKLPGSMSDTYEAEGILFEEIRALAQKYSFVCVTLEQANRGAWNADVVNASNIEGSKRKLNACELVLSLNRTREEFEHGFLRLHVDKNRNPRPGIKQPEFLPFRVDKQNFIIRDINEKEAGELNDLLNQGSGYESKFDGYTKAVDNVSNLNSKIGG